ncbi:MAG: MFS transporter [Bacteroidota bacterium]
MAIRPPFRTKLIYALGQLGWSLGSFGVLFQVAYFYLPPETGAQDFPTFIYQGPFLGFLTIIGLILFGGRVFDAITDPIIANYSDKSNSRLGKRKQLLAIAIVPFCVFGFLAFYPLSDTDTILNSIWLIAVVFLFYLSFSLYVVPYNALISELGHHPDDRMAISTMLSVAWAVGHSIGFSVFFMKDQLQSFLEPTQAFQLGLGILLVIAFIFMLIPILFLDEHKYALQTSSEFSLLKSMKKVWANKNFRIFTYADLTYWLSVTIIQMGIIYYVTVLLKLDEGITSVFLPIAMLLSFCFYYPINLMVKKYGKKKILRLGFIIFALTFLLALDLGKNPLSSTAQLGILAVLSAFPMAVFGIIPNAIIADLVNTHGKLHGDNQAGMYFGVRTFMMKLGTSLGILVFTSLLLLGKSVENDFGIRMTGFAALIFCIIGLLLFSKFKDLHEFDDSEK